jgi:hypothetical protein
MSGFDWPGDPICTLLCVRREDWHAESVYHIQEQLSSERVEQLANGARPIKQELELYWDSLGWSENAYEQYPWARVFEGRDGKDQVSYGVLMVDGLSPGLIEEWIEQTFKSVDEVIKYLKDAGYQPSELG